ncbi:hypothetical protein HYV86_00640 [Candidatus Woesearchaeota archaeon]|nr:hypothetical protein [Candidatus Woesearchaeota archaeon]
MKLHLYTHDLGTILHRSPHIFFEISDGVSPRDDPIEMMRTLTWRTGNEVQFLTRITGECYNPKENNGRCDVYSTYDAARLRMGVWLHAQKVEETVNRLFPYRNRDWDYTLGERIIHRSEIPGPTILHSTKLGVWTQLF